ncbi:MAG: hypothetical protein KGO82_15815, partial [Bacteroidota bacterium]|nr:hypothetical protein [Bacteroidota bacterium]
SMMLPATVEPAPAEAGGKKVVKFGSANVAWTWYVRDAQGNSLPPAKAGVMGVYTAAKDTVATDTTLSPFQLQIAEHRIYGSSRLGVSNLSGQDAEANLSTAPGNLTITRGERFYELSNHLGNVLAVISDKKMGHTSNSSSLDYYNPDIVSVTDYYPFGMVSRSAYLNNLNLNYRYSFNGKENDKDVKGDGNQIDYGARIYDPRVGRFLSVDPISAKFPDLTPFQYASNLPTSGIDLDGLEYSPSGKVGIFSIDNTAVQLYPNNPVIIHQQREKTAVAIFWYKIQQAHNQVFADGNIASFQKYLGDPDNIGGKAAFEISQNVHESKESFKQGDYVMGTIHALNAGVNTATLVGGGEALEVKTEYKFEIKPDVKLDIVGPDPTGKFVPQAPTLKEKRQASTFSEALVKSRLASKLAPDEVIVEKPRIYILNGKTYTVPDFAIYNTKTNKFVDIPDAKNGGGDLSKRQNILNTSGGEFRGSSRYPQVKPHQVSPGLVRKEKTEIPYKQSRTANW